jgi:myotubularin-related protein 14
MFSGANSNAAGHSATTQGHYSVNDTSENQMHDRVRGQDIRLLKHFSIGYIFDLMLECKKVKFGMNVTSSEKVDKENRYAEFVISSVPYPGCEFFKCWRDNGYRAEGLYFDWSQDFVDSRLELPSRPSPPRNIDWYSYQNWDLLTLTQNYLKLLLHYLREGDTGLLVHCISGWDRTPLFISLIRLSLWAEGLVHPSLSASEILYLTIGYDWFLFGHNFPDRLVRGEEVFFFCFTFLKHITSDEYNINRRHSKRTVSTADSDYLLDAVLLDGVSSCRGSNSSISSVSSLSSTRSGAAAITDYCQPVHFSVGSADDDLVLLHSMQSSSSTLKISPGYNNNRCSPYVDHVPSLCSGPATYTGGSSPMPVPRAVQRLTSELGIPSAASCGSWQFVSGADGSYRGVSSPAGSLRSHSGSSSHDTRGCGIETQRRQRLDDVRHLFVRLYTSVVGSCPSLSSQDSSGAGALLSGLLEKVGFRAPYSGFI